MSFELCNQTKKTCKIPKLHLFDWILYHQVQQELSSTFARLCHLADETTQDMQESIDKIDKSLSKLEEGASRSKVLRNQANFIANKLELFDRTYLASYGSAPGSDQDSNWASQLWRGDPVKIFCQSLNTVLVRMITTLSTTIMTSWNKFVEQACCYVSLIIGL